MLCKAWGQIGSKYPECWTYGEEEPPTSTSGGVPASPESPQQYNNWDGKPPLDPTIPVAQQKANRAATKRILGGAQPINNLVPLCTWEVNGSTEAENRLAALNFFKGLQRDGIPHTNGHAQAPQRVWRYKGSPVYLDRHIARLRLPARISAHGQKLTEVKAVSSLLGQLSNTYFKAIPKDGKPSLLPSERLAVKAALDQAEEFVGTLAAATAGMAEALDEARAAFGFDPKPRDFELISVYDQPATTNGKHHKEEKP